MQSYLASIGLDNVAKVVCNHTFHSIEHKVSQIDEEDVLCLADRMVLDDKYVGPEKRDGIHCIKGIVEVWRREERRSRRWSEKLC